MTLGLVAVMDAKMRKCQLCPSTFKTTKTLKGHYLKAHGLRKDDDIILTTPKSPKKQCGKCSKSVSNIWAHRSSCRARPKNGGDATTSGGEPSPVKAPPKTSVLTSQPSTSTQATDAVPERSMRATTDVMTDEEFMVRYRRWLEGATGNYAGRCISFHHPFPFNKFKSFPEACISFCFP